MAEIIWSARSLRDIDEIANYISKDSLQYAKEQVRQFLSKVKILEKHPLTGRMVPEVKIFAIRQILCGHYRIIYEILNHQQIGVITVHHQSRLLKNNPAMKKLVIRKKRK
ncbi:MAG: type II toxin-antitoxin system RelE/ParE family toxin [Ferruginibacter sp.]|nr:type II toxin-antitoxin system RelE/ParE family toxin [Chitinophagaceae bacterium]